jgi:hypothetical protein
MNQDSTLIHAFFCSMLSRMDNILLQKKRIEYRGTCTTSPLPKSDKKVATNI